MSGRLSQINAQSATVSTQVKRIRQDPSSHLASSVSQLFSVELSSCKQAPLVVTEEARSHSYPTSRRGPCPPQAAIGPPSHLGANRGREICCPRVYSIPSKPISGWPFIVQWHTTAFYAHWCLPRRNLKPLGSRPPNSRRNRAFGLRLVSAHHP